MAYKYDKDLEFLRKMKSSELSELVEILKGKKDSERISEEMTNNELFKKHYPNHKKYINLILEEFQRYGGNTFANIFRDGGVLYKKILCDVCNKMKVKYNKIQDTRYIEDLLLTKILSDSLKNIKAEDLKTISKDLKLETTDFTPNVVAAALQATVRGNGFLFYKKSVIVANGVAKSLGIGGFSLATNATITKTIGILAGPIGWFLVAALTSLSIAGPAYRVTIPAVIQVAFLRQVYLKRRNNAIIRCLIYSVIIGVLYYYGFTDSFFEWIYNWWND